MNKKFAKITAMLIIVLACLLVAPAAMAATTDDYEDLPGQEVRVLLYGSGTATSYSITIGSGNYYIVEADNPNNVIAEADSGKITFNYLGSNSYSVEVGGETFSGRRPFMAAPESADDYFLYDSAAYRGCFKAIHSGSYYYAINQINVELYLYGVVGKEIGYNYSDDSTMAQAVAARSYALANYSSSNVYYDMTNTTSSQVYGGKSAESDKIIKAVDNTCGMVLMYSGDYVHTYYSSNMGGYTENIENVWSSDEVPIKGVPSPYDAKAGNYSSYGASTYSWVVEYTPAQMVTLANAYGKTDIGEYKSIAFSTSLNGVESVSGRLMSVTIYGTKGQVSASKDSIRSLLNLKSTLVTIADNVNGKVSAYVAGEKNQNVGINDINTLLAADASGATMAINGDKSSFYVNNGSNAAVEVSKKAKTGNTIVISGKGYGHGVGLSQFGAIAMGDDGYGWDEIIEHYFCNNTGIKLVEDY